MSTPAVAPEVVWRHGRAEPDKGATPRDVRVALVAAQQHGMIATRQLRACGVDRDATRVRVASGRLHPVFRGVYAVGHAALTETALFTAAVLACGVGAVVSHHAAAALLGLLAWRGDRAPEVIVPRSAEPHARRIHAHRPRLDPRDVWTRENIRVTSPARTILDLATTRPHKPLRRLVRQAQAEQHVNVRQLLAILHRHPRHPGAARLRAVIADGPGPTRSDHEDIVLDLITQAGLERPESNPKLHLDNRDIHPDLLWRGELDVVDAHDLSSGGCRIRWRGGGRATGMRGAGARRSMAACWG